MAAVTTTRLRWLSVKQELENVLENLLTDTLEVGLGDLRVLGLNPSSSSSQW